MGKKLVLYDKIYNITSEKKRNDLIFRYKKYLNNLIKGFPKSSVSINKLRNYDKRFEIYISGPEEIFISNLFKKEIGVVIEFKDVHVGDVYKGTMVEVGKVGFGIFVDCAILNTSVDVLLNLNTLRRQLCKDKKLSLREIIKVYDFIDHFPIYMKITEVDKQNNKLLGEIAEKTLILFKKISHENIEALFMSGETKGQFKKALIQKGHLRDIISVKRYGFLEHIVLLKQSCEAPGIISKIGRNLTNCKLSALRSVKIKNVFE